MPTPMLIAMLALFGGMVGGRVLMQRAHQDLPDDRKLALWESFRRLQVYQLVPLIVLLVAFWVATRQASIDRRVLIGIFVGLSVAVIGSLQYVTWRRMRPLDLPAAFRRRYALGRACQLAGLALFLGLLLAGESMAF